MCEAESSPEEGEAHPRIPDLHAVGLSHVFGSDDSALANSIRRVTSDVTRSTKSYAAHGTTP